MTEFWRQRLEVPAYRVGEVASYVHLSPSAITAWERVQQNRTAVVSSRKPRDGLSYLQLIEIAIVASMRQVGVKLREIAEARTYLSRAMGETYPFAKAEFKSDGVDVLLEYKTEAGKVLSDRLLAANHSGQLIWAEMIEQRIMEFRYDPSGYVRYWLVAGVGKDIVIDPAVAFGSPQVNGVPTWRIKTSWAAGYTIPEIADDYDLPEAQIADALVFEGIVPEVLQ